MSQLDFDKPRSAASQAVGPDSPLVAFTDRNLVVTLILHGKHWVERYKMSVHKTVFYFNRADVLEVVALWQSGQPIPCTDLRDVYKAEAIFNAAVHDEI